MFSKAVFVCFLANYIAHVSAQGSTILCITVSCGAGTSSGTTTTGTSQQYPAAVQYSAPSDTTGYSSGQSQAQAFAANQDIPQQYAIDNQLSSSPINSNIGSQTDSAAEQQSQQDSALPGYLPNYQGDQYTDPQRVQETQRLNNEFYQSIGGEPSYPGGVTPSASASTTATVTSVIPSQQQPASGPVSAGLGYGYTNTAYSSPAYGTPIGYTGTQQVAYSAPTTAVQTYQQPVVAAQTAYYQPAATYSQPVATQYSYSQPAAQSSTYTAYAQPVASQTYTYSQPATQTAYYSAPAQTQTYYAPATSGTTAVGTTGSQSCCGSGALALVICCCC